MAKILDFEEAKGIRKILSKELCLRLDFLVSFIFSSPCTAEEEKEKLTTMKLHTGILLSLWIRNVEGTFTTDEKPKMVAPLFCN